MFRKEICHDDLTMLTSGVQIHEKFDTGTVFGLKELISVKNVSRTMHFYPSSRLDGLLVREEVSAAFVSQLVEIF